MSTTIQLHQEARSILDRMMDREGALDDEDEVMYDGPGEMMREEQTETIIEEAVEKMDEMVGELRKASQTHADQATRLHNLSAVLKSLRG